MARTSVATAGGSIFSLLFFFGTVYCFVYDRPGLGALFIGALLLSLGGTAAARRKTRQGQDRKD